MGICRYLLRYHLRFCLQAAGTWFCGHHRCDCRLRDGIGLASFAGAGRQFERLGETASGALVIDDYAHHPTEVAATSWRRSRWSHGDSSRSSSASVQPDPRAASRVRGGACAGRRRRCAGRLPSPQRAEDFGVSSSCRGRRRRRPPAAPSSVPTFEQALTVLGPRLRAGDLVLVMGAGDVDALGRALVGARHRRGLCRLVVNYSRRDDTVGATTFVACRQPMRVTRAPRRTPTRMHRAAAMPRVRGIPARRGPPSGPLP